MTNENEEVRCPSRILFVIDHEDGLAEFKCNSRNCGAGPGVVVLHKVDLFTKELVSTQVYRAAEAVFDHQRP